MLELVYLNNGWWNWALTKKQIRWRIQEKQRLAHQKNRISEFGFSPKRKSVREIKKSPKNDPERQVLELGIPPKNEIKENHHGITQKVGLLDLDLLKTRGPIQ